ncbi:MAG: hypothetical protein ACP5FK_10975 [bacterium]
MNRTELKSTEIRKKSLNRNLRSAWISLIVSVLVIIFTIWFALEFIESIQNPANDPWPQFIVVIVMFFIPFISILGFIAGVMLFVGIYSIIRYKKLHRICHRDNL